MNNTATLLYIVNNLENTNEIIEQKDFFTVEDQYLKEAFANCDYSPDKKVVERILNELD